MRMNWYLHTTLYAATFEVKLPNFKLELQLVSLSSLSGFFPPHLSHPLYNNLSFSFPPHTISWFLHLESKLPSSSWNAAGKSPPPSRSACLSPSFSISPSPSLSPFLLSVQFCHPSFYFSPKALMLAVISVLSVHVMLSGMPKPNTTRTVWRCTY